MLRELRRHRICHHFCCWSAPAIPVSEEAAETIWRALNAVSTCRLSCNIQTLFYWGRKGELYTSYHIRLISKYKDLKTKVVSWFSLVIGQNASRQLATSSENLVASAQFLVALATSESQFRALLYFQIHFLVKECTCMPCGHSFCFVRWSCGIFIMVFKFSSHNPWRNKESHKQLVFIFLHQHC